MTAPDGRHRIKEGQLGIGIISDVENGKITDDKCIDEGQYAYAEQRKNQRDGHAP